MTKRLTVFPFFLNSGFAAFIMAAGVLYCATTPSPWWVQVLAGAFLCGGHFGVLIYVLYLIASAIEDGARR